MAGKVIDSNLQDSLINAEDAWSCLGPFSIVEGDIKTLRNELHGTIKGRTETVGFVSDHWAVLKKTSS